ncbi:acyl-CoA reductase LuxC [Tamaricihabitans halophyticus]|uniref:Acyl-CoA reductase LuxC n=1 Tax=Tamaricihabitans halophyticus TaxID=1262583 RepID=A0A4R2R5L6_9PSEU|nr:acyl-CoA reductase [Tamaricihabitans halophyticus]TCP57058.1 acyl-CoA reductase LuxC [Tamaricihabitans halophyticus]
MRQLFPAPAETTAERVVAELSGENPLRFGDERVIDFLGKLARRLLAPDTARAYPELAALGFFLRPGELRKVLDTAPAPDGGYRFPRGLCFHVPPANVDTMFVYSWALSALAGNPNIVRVSPRVSGAGAVLLDALAEIADSAEPAVASTQRMVSYPRDPAATGAFSAACELRVLWGGDRAINELREHRLAPNARDLTFPDRASFAVISLAGWQAASAAERRAAVEAFYADAYWFDQAACASPRAVYWIGAGEMAEARDEFNALLAEIVALRGYALEPAMAVEQRVAGYGLAADGRVRGLDFGAGVATVDLADPADPPRQWLAAGTFAHTALSNLTELAGLVRRTDQTLIQFGCTEDELAEFVAAAAGKGIDRIVPFGSALRFDPIWDGYDLLREFSRLVTVRAR